MGNDQKQIFRPDKIPTELPNLVYIEGPNSSGKSTLLHILALSMYGLENQKINSSLREKMDSLLNSKYQKLKFDVNITNGSENLKIISTKKEFGDSEILVLESKDGEKDRPLSSNSFKNRYNLIYDIPDNPIGRLKELTQEIKDEQNRYGTRVHELEDYIGKIVHEISESRDPKRLEDLKAKLKQLEDEKNELVTNKNHSQNILDILEEYAACKYYIEYMDKAFILDKRIQDLNKKRGSRTKVKKRFTTQYSNLYSNITNSLDEMDSKFRSVTSSLNNLLPKKEEPHLNIWKRINLYDATVDYEFNQNLKKETIHFIKILNNETKFIKENTSLKEAQAVSDLIDFLKGYEDSLPTLPGIEMSLSEFIITLELSNKKNQDLVTRSSNLNNTIQQLRDLNKIRAAVENDLPKLKTLSEKEMEAADSNSMIDELEDEISNLNLNLQEIASKIDHYAHLCMNKNIDVSSLSSDLLISKLSTMEKNQDLFPYFSYNEKQLNEKITQLESDLNDFHEIINEKDLFIRDYEKDISRLEEKEPHKYQEYSDDLNLILQKSKRLRQKLVKEYNEYVGLLQKENPCIDSFKDGMSKRYFDEVSKYLANRIGTFRHIDDDYTAVFIDLVSGEITTKENHIIRLKDMGTGQSQSAYLTGLLNVKDDTRKIIAIFDEVGMMDSTSLDRIYQKLNELYKSGRLLAGIVVQKADEVNIISKLQV